MIPIRLISTLSCAILIVQYFIEVHANDELNRSTNGQITAQQSGGIRTAVAEKYDNIKNTLGITKGKMITVASRVGEFVKTQTEKILPKGSKEGPSSA